MSTARDKRGTTPALSIAPMMDRTDSHFRVLMRLLSRNVLLYTEMVTTNAVIHGRRERLLNYEESEHPIALQVGGDQPELLAQCARVAEDLGYDEINLNVGCPSDRVQNGNFGACLMKDPKRVGDAVAAMRAVTRLPVTVKHRIGVDDLDRYEDMVSFVATVAEAGCDRFSVHARKAWLSGLSPRENREIPPLRYEDVYRLKREFPALDVELNGGIRDLEAGRAHLQHVDAIMIGRFAWEHPYAFAQADHLYFDDAQPSRSRAQVIEEYVDHAARSLVAGQSAASVLRVVLNLFVHRPGSRRWKHAVDKVIKDKGDNLSSLVSLAYQIGTFALIGVLMACGAAPGSSSASTTLAVEDSSPHHSTQVGASGTAGLSEGSASLPQSADGVPDAARVGRDREAAPLQLHMAAVTTYALDSQGAVLAWGCNRGGALGVGRSDEFDTGRAVRVSGLPAVAMLTVSRGPWTTACALEEDGSAWCWGSALLLPRLEELAGSIISTRTFSRMLVSPVRLPSLDHSKAIALSDTWSCRIDRLAAVECWLPSYLNDEGENGGTSTADAPVSVALPGPAKALAVGSEHGCVILGATKEGDPNGPADGSVACFGGNARGQRDGIASKEDAKSTDRGHGQGHGGEHHEQSSAGSGERLSDLRAATLVPGLRDVVAIAASGSTTCVIHGGEMSCWGGVLEGAGVLALPLPSPAVSLFAAESEICVVDEAGALRCMSVSPRLDCFTSGLSDVDLKKCTSGELRHNASSIPWRVVDQGPMTLAAVSRENTYCVIGVGAIEVKCTGNNEHGRNGDGTYTASTTPTAVQGSGAAATSIVAPPRPIVIAPVQGFDQLPPGCEPNQLTYSRVGEVPMTLEPASAWASVSAFSLDVDLRSHALSLGEWRDRTVLRGLETRISITLLHERDQDLVAPDLGRYLALLPGRTGRSFALSWMDLHFFDGVPSGRPHTPTHHGQVTNPTGHLDLTTISEDWVCGKIEARHGDLTISGSFSAQRVPDSSE